MFNMKRFSYLIASVALLLGAFEAVAQENKVEYSSEEEVYEMIEAPKQLYKGDFFVGIGGGASVYFGEHDRQMKFHHRLAPAMDVYAGKWITPWFGMRFSYSGGRAAGATNVDTGLVFNTGSVYTKDKGKWLWWQEFDYFGVRADFMFNLMSLLGGENPDRFYEISPYVGVGVNKVYNTPLEETCLGITIGIYNTFRISDSFDIVLDVHGTAVDEKFEHETGVRPGVKPNGLYSYDGILTAALGVAYNF